MRPPHHPPTEQLELARVLHALSDPVRLAIVAELDERPADSCGALKPDGLSKSTLSHHLKVLRESGVIEIHNHGTRRCVSLREQDLAARFGPLLGCVLEASREPAYA